MVQHIFVAFSFSEFSFVLNKHEGICDISSRFEVRYCLFSVSFSSWFVPLLFSSFVFCVAYFWMLRTWAELLNFFISVYVLRLLHSMEIKIPISAAFYILFLLDCSENWLFFESKLCVCERPKKTKRSALFMRNYPFTNYFCVGKCWGQRQRQSHSSSK